ncbi:hypothetical protein MRX96_045857 [Rhipicephalus microplus]
MTVVSSRTVAPHNREQVPAAVLTVTAVGARGAGRRGTQQLEAVAHVTPGLPVRAPLVASADVERVSRLG